MKKQMLYKEFAKQYDLIYGSRNYEKQGTHLKRIISKYKKSKGNELLEMACGTGLVLQQLKKDFTCTGVDLHHAMLAVAKKNVKGVTFKQGNMINFDLYKKFDILICLFSSIGYARTYANLKKTINNFAAHLKQGGVLIIEPWFTNETYKPGTPHMDTSEGKDIKIARLTVPQRKGNVAIMDMHYLIAEKNKGVRHYVDRHELGLFSHKRMMKFMHKAGIDPRFLKKEFTRARGLFIGVKR